MNPFVTPRSLVLAAILALGAATGAAAADRIALPSEKAQPAAEVAQDAIVVHIAKMKYDTPELKVKVGDTVTWINDEAMPHNVAFKKGVVAEGDFKGEMLKKGEAYSITFNEAGTYEYHCTPHPFMRAKIIVE